jgi:hypothetical protein
MRFEAERTMHDLARVSRRELLKTMSLASLAYAAGVKAATTQPKPRRPTLAIVSRHLQWTDYKRGIEVAHAAGFPGIIWTVRKGAHVEPENVARDLPKIVEATRAAGLEVPMIITGIADVDAPKIDAILGTLQSLGIQRYRAAAPRYDYEHEFAPQYDAFAAKLRALADLNRRYGTTALFHTHSYANTIGGAAWDLWMVMKDLDPRFVGINFDIGHVTAKGGAGWREAVRAAHRYIQSLSVKDFLWMKRTDVAVGTWPWHTEFVQPGDGMVDFPDFFAYCRSMDFAGPIECYFEYKVPIPGSTARMDMLGTDYGKWQLEVDPDYFISLLKRDADFYKNLLRAAGFDAA